MKLLKEFLVSNNYPVDFIDKNISRRLKNLDSKKMTDDVSSNQYQKEFMKKKRFVIPYYKYVTPDK